MRRRPLAPPALSALLAAAAMMIAWPAPSLSAPFAQVLPGHTLVFPRDRGSHPKYRVEWWYLTGWLHTRQHHNLGFQITFFRTRVAQEPDNPSAFTPRQLLFAHCAISDPAHGRLWFAQRIRRAGLGLAEAQIGETNVWIDSWRLVRRGNSYLIRVATGRFALHLQAAVTQPPMLNGEGGYSQKGPRPTSASEYYSEPHLRVTGHIMRAGRVDRVTGEAWLDHEWASQYLDPAAVGWDWIGVNLDDGGALMAFRIRDRKGRTFWAGATLREPNGRTEHFAPGQVQFVPGRRWHSPHTGIVYPVTWHVQVGSHHFQIEPLMNDQEFDARATAGAVYWEGAVRVRQAAHLVGRGYLELTGYGRPLSLAAPAPHLR